MLGNKGGSKKFGVSPSLPFTVKAMQTRMSVSPQFCNFSVLPIVPGLFSCNSAGNLPHNLCQKLAGGEAGPGAAE